MIVNFGFNVPAILAKVMYAPPLRQPHLHHALKGHSRGETTEHTIECNIMSIGRRFQAISILIRLSFSFPKSQRYSVCKKCFPVKATLIV